MPGTSQRQDFPPAIREAISKRASYICSNPNCRRFTLAPSENEPEKFILIGEAAHITAASPGFARYDGTLTKEQRTSAENGIFLCASCATMIDKNQGADFPVELLKKWKREHEEWVAANLNQNPFAASQDERDIAALTVQLGSPTNAFAVEAVRILRARGWLLDGTLVRTRLQGANLQGADLSNADLREADLSGSNLQDTNLEETNFERASLRGAILRGANLRGTNVENSNFAGANLYEARNLVTTQATPAARGIKGLPSRAS